MTYSARDIYRAIGYKKWSSFLHVIAKSNHIINNGLHAGVIKNSSKRARLAKGAIREIIDFNIDEQALDLIKNISGNKKLFDGRKITNEIQVLNLLRKYCENRGISFEFQFKLDNFFFDAKIENILIEFDEPHHADIRNVENDLIKSNYAKNKGFFVERFNCSHDIIDIIIKLKI